MQVICIANTESLGDEIDGLSNCDIVSKMVLRKVLEKGFKQFEKNFFQQFQAKLIDIFEVLYRF